MTGIMSGRIEIKITFRLYEGRSFAGEELGELIDEILEDLNRAPYEGRCRYVGNDSFEYITVVEETFRDGSSRELVDELDSDWMLEELQDAFGNEAEVEAMRVEYGNAMKEIETIPYCPEDEVMDAYYEVV